ncbi:MAG: hypothetical protein ACNS64_03705, partial [Candidatus Halalkalibacterium sp. M3_1C_030]
SFIKPSRTIIINPYHPNISNFTDMEKMVFRDMAEQLGARIVRFKFGESVNSRSFDLNSLESQTVV